MSTNDKNKIRPAFLMNFTNDILHRIVVIADNYGKKTEINNKIGEINEEVNLIIHNLNLQIQNRLIPYIKVKATFVKLEADKLADETRIIIDKYPVDEDYDDFIIRLLQVSKDEISHIVDVLIAPGQNRFCVSSLSCDARLVLDYSLFQSAVEDILLDISMFNSYSFLRCLSMEKKKEFSQKKYQFCKEKERHFENVEGGTQQYFSLAFAAHNQDGKLDLTNYISIWDEFVNTTYPNRLHEEKSVKEQLQTHKDFLEIPKNYDEIISQKGKGTYLVLRTNKDVTESIHPQLESFFGFTPKNPYRKGKLKIVPIDDYQRVLPLMEHLDVSAFKVIVP